MTEGQDAALVTWVATLSHEEAVRNYRALLPDERRALEEHAWAEVTQAFYSGEPYGPRFENLARRFEIFAEDSAGLSAEICLKTAHDLRHLDEWRAAHAAQDQVSERRLKAMALASSCWTREPLDVRLRRVEEVLPQINQLADEARVEGNRREHSAIGEDIAGLWKLRDALKRRL